MFDRLQGWIIDWIDRVLSPKKPAPSNQQPPPQQPAPAQQPTPQATQQAAPTTNTTQNVAPVGPTWGQRLKKKIKTLSRIIAFVVIIALIGIFGGPVATIVTVLALGVVLGIVFLTLPWLAQENVLVTKVSE